MTSLFQSLTQPEPPPLRTGSAIQPGTERNGVPENDTENGRRGATSIFARRPSFFAMLLLMLLATPATAQDAGTEPASAPPATTTASEAAGSEKSATDPVVAPAAAEKKPEIKLPPPPPDRPAEIPIELVPYTVDLPIVFAPSPRLGAAFQQQVISDVAALVKRDVGPMWDLTISEPDWVTPRNRDGIRRLTSEQIKRRLVIEKLDTVIREQLNVYCIANEEPAEDDAASNTSPETAEDAAPETAEDAAPVAAKPTVKPFPSDPDPNLSDSRRAQLGTILDQTETAAQDALVREYVEQLADERVSKAGRDTASEVVSLYILPPSVDRDKMFPVAVEFDGSEYVVSGREWDRESEVFSPVRSRRTSDRRAVATEVFRLLEELFHPIAQIDEADPVSATLRLKASEFPSADPAFQQVQKGATFIPFFRYLDRNRVLQKLQFLPWSYITVDSTARIRATCRLDTGVKTPLGSFRRRRMELRALLIKPEGNQTTLTVVPRQNLNRPLVGYLVAVYDELPPPPAKPGGDGQEKLDAALAVEKKEEGPKPEILRTDRFGHVTIPRDPEHPLQWVFIRSGAALLTKFPLIPGVEANMRAECPDDTIRLDVEGQMVLLQSRLIDTIAKRAMVQAMIKSRAAKSEWEKVDESLVELDELPTISDFQEMVKQIQFPAIKTAQARKDPISERRIGSLGKDILKVAGGHLDEAKLNEFRDEIEEQRRLDGAAPAGPRRPAARRQ